MNIIVTFQAHQYKITRNHGMGRGVSSSGTSQPRLYKRYRYDSSQYWWLCLQMSITEALSLPCFPSLDIHESSLIHSDLGPWL